MGNVGLFLIGFIITLIGFAGFLEIVLYDEKSEFAKSLSEKISEKLEPENLENYVLYLILLCIGTLFMTLGLRRSQS